MYVLNLSYSKSPAEVEPVYAPHMDWVKKYVADGTFLVAAAKKSGLGGILLVKSIDKRELQRIIAEDPYVTEDVGEYQIADIDVKLAQPMYEALKQA